MIHQHSHNHGVGYCTHSLEYCKDCDVVYCTMCSKEWVAKEWTNWRYWDNGSTGTGQYYEKPYFTLAYGS